MSCKGTNFSQHVNRFAKIFSFLTPKTQKSCPKVGQDYACVGADGFEPPTLCL